MVCSICNGTGHNRRTCPQRNPNITQVAVSIGPTPPRRRRPLSLIKASWKVSTMSIIDLIRFLKVSLNLNHHKEKLKYAYLHWLRIKDLFVGFFPGYPHTLGECVLSFLNLDISQYKIQILNNANQACLEYHKGKNSIKENKKKIKLINMRNDNYLIYWVVGNIMIEDIDSKENSINYMGILRKNDTFGLNTMIGHRFYLVPHRLDIEPPYHPETDKQFFIEPYLQLNIHEGSSKEIHIDDGENLSELNRWKFNALKLDYLIRELIKLGAKNNETLDVVLDLHEDIKLDNVSEWYKDIAGVPSTFTNIT